MILPAITRTGVTDAGNGGNPFLPGTGWDVLFDAPLWQAQVDEAEIWQMQADGPVGSSFRMCINGKPWNDVLQGWQNYNDPNQPPVIDVGTSIQFYWNFAFAAGPYTASGGSNVLPTVTIHLRTVR
jgi:hypothetical protein